MKIEEAIRYFEAKENETVEALAWLKSKAMNDHIEWERELTATRMAIQALHEKRERIACPGRRGTRRTTVG